MIKILFVANTFYRGKRVFLEIPMIDKPKSKKSRTGDSKEYERNFSLSESLLTSYKNANNNLFAEVFSLKNTSSNSLYIFDIIIEEYRYISCPIFIDHNKYIKKYIENEEFEDSKKNPTMSKNKEENKEIIRLNMFNIVLVFEKSHKILFYYLDNIYKILESFSHFNLFEEYKSNYIGHEIFKLMKIEKAFRDQQNEEQNNDNEGLESMNKRILSESHLAKNLKKLYEDFSHNYIKLFINSWFDFKISLKINSDPFEVKPYHTLLITKKKSVDEFLIQNHDVSPMIKNFLEIVNPFKNLEELALENDFSYDYIIMIAKQIYSWGFGRFIKKLNNHSILTINQNTYPKWEVEKNFEKKELKCGGMYDLINCFIIYQPIDTLFSEQFNQISNSNFKNVIEFLLQSEYLVTCSQYFLSKLPFQKTYDYEKILFGKVKQILKQTDHLEKFEAENIRKSSEIEESNQKRSFYNYTPIFIEDIVKLMKNEPNDGEIFKNIYYFLSEDFEIEEISYLTGYKIGKILDLLKRYKFLFDMVIIPNEN